MDFSDCMDHAPAVREAPAGRLLVATVLSKGADLRFFPLLKQSCERWGTDLRVFGADRKWRSMWFNKAYWMYREAIRLIDEYDGILFTDANDTFYQRSPAHALAELQAMGGGFIIGAEDSPWPWVKRHKDVVRSNTHRHVRYPNAGMWIADRQGFKTAFEAFFDITDDLSRDGYNEHGYAAVDDDQLQWHELLSRNSPAVKLDDQCRILFNLQQGTKADIEWTPDGVRNARTGTHPIALHSPGCWNYELLLRAWRLQWPIDGLIQPSRDVTSVVARSLVATKSRLRIRADNRSMGGDPIPGVKKKLRVTYEVQGERSTATIEEDETLVIRAASCMPSGTTTKNYPVGRVTEVNHCTISGTIDLVGADYGWLDPHFG